MEENKNNGKKIGIKNTSKWEKKWMNKETD